MVQNPSHWRNLAQGNETLNRIQPSHNQFAERATRLATCSNGVADLRNTLQHTAPHESLWSLKAVLEVEWFERNSVYGMSWWGLVLRRCSLDAGAPVRCCALPCLNSLYTSTYHTPPPPAGRHYRTRSPGLLRPYLPLTMWTSIARRVSRFGTAWRIPLLAVPYLL